MSAHPRPDVPQPDPAFAIDELPNLRDLGGLPFEGGGRTREGVLWRSAAPFHGDRLPHLPGWPARTVVDLRGLDELAGRPHPLEVDGTTVHALPLLRAPVTGESTSLSAVADLGTVYKEYLRHGAGTVAQVVTILSRTQGVGLVHCTAGKDRTGVTVAALLRAAGVTREAIVADYRATEPAMPAILARIPPEVTAQFDPTVTQRLMGVPAEAMTAVLDEFDATPGGAAGWLVAAGATEQDVRAWIARLRGPRPLPTT